MRDLSTKQQAQIAILCIYTVYGPDQFWDFFEKELDKFSDSTEEIINAWFWMVDKNTPGFNRHKR